YACRPPGMPHGPWTSDEGVLMIEFRYDFPPESR
ncbi:MAG TPA: cupin, partial [Acidimicrobiaceae bacterium]|nr:cupin [Acidimicrobiaceae bacterium]